MFTWVMVAVATWSTMYFCWLMSDDAKTALVYCRLLSAAAIMIPVCYAHFIINLTGASHQREMRARYVIAAILFGLSFTPLIVSHVEANKWFPFWPKAGALYPLYLGFFFYIFVRVTTLLLGEFKRATFLRRNQLLYVIIFTLIGLLGASTNYFLWYNIPIPPVGNIFVSVYMIGVAYAVIRFRLMEFNLLIARSISYIVLILLIALLQTVAVIILNRTSDGAIEAHYLVFTGALAGTILLIIWGPRLRIKIDNLLEQRFLGEMSSRRAKLRELTHQISTIKDEDGIFKQTVQSVAETLQVDHVGILMRIDYESNFTLKAAISNQLSRLSNLAINDQSPLISVLQKSPNALLLDELEHNQSSKDRQSIALFRRESGIELAVPIYAGNFFYGFLAMGPRKTDIFFSNTDLTLLEALGLQIGLNLRTRQLERQANHSEKLISLGTLAAGLAHEIRNPLVSIRTFSELIGEENNDADFYREFKNIVGRDVTRIAAIVENISAFAENSQVKTGPVDVKEVINGVYDIAKTEFTKAGVLFEKSELDIPFVQGNYSQLLQVFLNLFQNAIHALEGSVSPCVKVGYRLALDEEGGQTLIVSVTDNGAGIDEIVRARIFDPFITTKATGDRGVRRGMGLGLAIVKRIIEAHRGAINVTSESGRGTTFYLHLPCVK
jgi:two-component system nitrogen regulation sensor histidine kinase GlnL